MQSLANLFTRLDKYYERSPTSAFEEVIRNLPGISTAGNQDCSYLEKIIDVLNKGESDFENAQTFSMINLILQKLGDIAYQYITCFPNENQRSLSNLNYLLSLSILRDVSVSTSHDEYHCGGNVQNCQISRDIAQPPKSRHPC